MFAVLTGWGTGIWLVWRIEVEQCDSSAIVFEEEITREMMRGGRVLGSTEFRGPVERIRAQTVEFVANKQMPRRFKDDGNSIARLFDFQSDAEWYKNWGIVDLYLYRFFFTTIVIGGRVRDCKCYSKFRSFLKRDPISLRHMWNMYMYYKISIRFVHTKRTKFFKNDYNCELIFSIMFYRSFFSTSVSIVTRIWWSFNTQRLNGTDHH